MADLGVREQDFERVGDDEPERTPVGERGHGSENDVDLDDEESALSLCSRSTVYVHLLRQCRTTELILRFLLEGQLPH